jgi:hypothetical protein|tara:strand:+ start:87 stop:344 length:258 start_codon:yes stop_codon:yes gene_type:complete
MKLKFVNPKKLKVLMAVFFGVGLWGIVFGLWLGNFATTSSQSLNYFMIVILGVINLLLGGLVSYLFLTQERKIDPRKDSKYKRKK